MRLDVDGSVASLELKPRVGPRRSPRRRELQRGDDRKQGPRSEGGLTHGMIVTLGREIGQAAHPKARRSRVLNPHTQNITAIATVTPDSTVRYQAVTIGRDHGSWVEVTGGLAEGAHVVLNPSDDLRDGARVRTASVAGSSQ